MKLRVYFALLVLLLLLLFGVVVYREVAQTPPTWLAPAFVALFFLTLLYLVLFYQKVARPIQDISIGMDLLREQDFSSRLRKSGQYEADRVVELFNKMMEELKNERLTLREQNEFLDLLIAASPMGVVVMDYDGKMVELNPASRRQLAIKEEQQVLGKTPAEAEAHLRIDLQQVPKHETRTIGLSDGTIYKCTHETFVDKGFPRSFFLIESLTEEVHQAEKKAYEKVIRMIAHEVNNTTAGITSTLDTIEQELEPYSDLDDIREAMRICIERAYHMSHFITNFADVVRIPEAHPQLIDLNELIATQVQFMTPNYSAKGISIHFTPNEAFGEVEVDSSLFELVLQNIIKNSAESILEREVPTTEGMITLTLDTEPRQLTITDNGVGITKEQAPFLFRPFFSTKPTGQGIGLLLIREVLQKHGFLYSLQSDADGLTRFAITF